MKESHKNWVKEKISGGEETTKDSTNDLLNILIIEDDNITQEWVQAIIEEVFIEENQLNFVFADSVEKALNTVNEYKNNFKLITVDGNLGMGGRGWDFIHGYKAASEIGVDSIIIFSGLDDFVNDFSKKRGVEAFHKSKCEKTSEEWDPLHYEEFKEAIRKRLNP